MDIDIDRILSHAEKLGPSYVENIIKAFSSISDRDQLSEQNCDCRDIPWEDEDFSRRIFYLATRSYDETVIETDFLVKKARLEPGMQILDIASGDGRLSLEFGRRGFIVTGVDKGIGGIEFARRIADKEGIADVRFIHANAAEADFDSTFDFAMIIYGAIANFTSSEASQLIDKLSRSIKTGGRLVIEVCLLMENAIGDFQDWYFSGAGLWGDSMYLVLVENFFQVQDSYMAIRHWIIDIATGDLKMITGREQYYDRDSIADLLRMGEFEIEYVWGGWDASEFTGEGDCMIVQAVKHV